MLEDQRPGTIYWIDHYVVPTADVPQWTEFYTNVFGATAQVREPRPDRPDRPVGLQFTHIGKCHVGGSLREQLRPSTGHPRYGWFIHSEQVEEHLRRLDAHGVAHSGPIRTSEEGEDGVAIRFTDPDGNPLELWAPDQLPDGAMADETPAHVGRISSAAFESRDLDRTVDFYSRFCALDPLQSAELAADTVVFPLAAGGRLVFRRVDELGNRTGGHAAYHALHTALVIRDDEFLPALQRMYQELPEWDYDPHVIGELSLEQSSALPARTGIHGNPIGPDWKRAFGRGDSFYDWDQNTYHFVNAKPLDGSMARYESVSQRGYVERRQAGQL
jgi:predicted enzyme related to lactoylglutathione lyase